MFRIMLVDDEPNILLALKRDLLQLRPDDLDGERAVIETFTAGEAALARADEVGFDLVISDYRMPGMDGVEFLTRMIERQPGVARVILSGYTDLKAMIAAINDIQIFRYLTKPWFDDLRLVVRQALAQRALLMENERLANAVRTQQRTLDQQQYELRRLEAECPGITQLHLSDDGRIMIPDSDDTWDSVEPTSWQRAITG